MLKANLSGHSGCSIQLMEEEGHLFVRKTSNSETYNRRLADQCHKQEEYRHPSFSAPTVLDKGLDSNGLFFFDMEYVKGIALSEYIKTIEVYRMRDFVGGLIDNLLRADIGDSSQANEVFGEKIESLRQSIGGRDTTIDRSLEVLSGYDWSCFGQSSCHGDLTLENIIVKGEDIFLIDFLDSFYDSVYLDMGKMLQDVIALWSYRHDRQVTANTLIRLKVFKDLLLEKVAFEPAILSNCYHALLLHLLRILPYAKDRHTYDYVVEKMAMTLNLIRP